MKETPVRRLTEVARLFFKLGVVGFGGPAAHIAMMEDEVVSRRGWLERDHFLDLVGATNLIPGPNSTEMAIHIGYIYAGVPGLITAGVAFITPAFVMVTALAWAYTRYGQLPGVNPFLAGIKPVVVAIILGAVIQLGRSALKGLRLGVVGATVLVAVLLGLNEILALLGGAVCGMVLLRLTSSLPSSSVSAFIPLSEWAREALGRVGAVAGLAGAALATTPVSLLQLGWFFLQVGAVLYGSGYVLVAFLQGGLVDQYGWLTQAQLLDAISAGQFTPGPVLTTSAFIGYLLAGMRGALVSAGAIFLPSFFFVLALNPIIPKLRQSRWTAAFLDAANISAVALMGAVTLELGAATLVDPVSWALGLTAALLRLRWNVSPSLLIVGGGVGGWLLRVGLSGIT